MGGVVKGGGREVGRQGGREEGRWGRGEEGVWEESVRAWERGSERVGGMRGY